MRTKPFPHLRHLLPWWAKLFPTAKLARTKSDLIPIVKAGEAHRSECGCEEHKAGIRTHGPAGQTRGGVAMADRSDELRRRAADCLALARATSDPHARLSLPRLRSDCTQWRTARRWSSTLSYATSTISRWCAPAMASPWCSSNSKSSPRKRTTRTKPPNGEGRERVPPGPSSGSTGGHSSVWRGVSKALAESRTWRD